MTSCRHTRRDLPRTSYNALMAGKELMSRRNDLLERGGARRRWGGGGGGGCHFNLKQFKGTLPRRLYFLDSSVVRAPDS